MRVSTWQCCRFILAVLPATVILGGCLFLQIRFHLLPQLHHNDNYMATTRYITSITSYPSNCTRSTYCPRYGTSCATETYNCLKYNVTWVYSIGSGFDRGGRYITVVSRNYTIYTSGDSSMRPGERRTGYYDPHDPYNLWDGLDTSHRDGAIATTFFLSLVFVPTWVSVCSEQMGAQPRAEPQKRTRALIAPREVQIVIIEAPPPPYTDIPTVPPPPYSEP